MKKTLKKSLESIKIKKINFSEKYFLSEDKKTVLGETSFQDILFLEYRDSSAGSNPREYTGIKQVTNLNILKSLLKDPVNMFRFLHSGIIVSITNYKINQNEKYIKYEDCCLTNGNQTRFIILIIVLLKMYSLSNRLKDINIKKFEDFIDTNFSSERVSIILKNLKYSKIKEIINFLSNNGKYLRLFNEMNIENFLNCKIRIQLNLIDNIIEDLEDELDEFEAGTLIAQANNDTQKVKVDDIFGNKYKKDLQEKIFKKFTTTYTNVEVEYRYGEVVDANDKVHILTLLRPVIATGILTKEKEIFNLSNKRDPIYKIFEKLINNNKAKKTTKIVSLLIPLIYNLRIKYLIPKLKEHSRELLRRYKEKVVNEDIDESYIIYKELSEINGDDLKLTRLLKPLTHLNPEHVILAFIFTIRKLFNEKNSNEIQLGIESSKIKSVLDAIIEMIADQYVEKRMKGLPSSLTTFVRSEEFFKFGIPVYTFLKNKGEITESSFINDNRFPINL